MPTWDNLQILGGYRDDDSYLSVSTVGCDCCSEGDTYTNKNEAVEVIKTYIEERKIEIQGWEEWLKRMATSDKIIP